MIKIFVLVLFLTGYEKGGATSIEFVSHAECVAAGEKIQQHFTTQFSSVAWQCIEKTDISR